MTSKKQIFSFIFLISMSFIILYFISIYALNPAIDTGRELFIPYRMLNGEILYKDILNIYGALAYQINTFAYMILGAKVNTLRIFGSLNYMIIICSIWFILKELIPNCENITFFSKIENRCLSSLMIFFIFVTIFSPNVFNYILPYSFAITYGISFFVLSLLFFIKFAKTDIPKFAYLACFFAGGAISCKYEFLLYFVFLLLYILGCKKIETKNVLFSILFLGIIPLLSYGSLFWQGMTSADLAKNALVMKQISKTQAVKFLYSNFAGTYFNYKIFSICFIKTLILAVVSVIFYYSQRFIKTDKFLALIVLLFGVIGIYYASTVGFSLFAIINSILFLIYFKQLYQNKPVFVYILSTILLSLKTFFVVNVESYGIYTLPFIIISLFLILEYSKFTEKEDIKNGIKGTFFFVLALLIFIFYFISGFQIFKKKGYIHTEEIKNGTFFELFKKEIYTYPDIANPLNEAIEYINKNTKPSDRIVVLPETQFLNFITQRPSDNLYDSLTPMYFEAFGEYNIIHHFEQTMPEYFIINNRDTSDYGKRYICDNYGREFCSFVKDNYKKVNTFGETTYILQVFKRKDLL